MMDDEAGRSICGFAISPIFLATKNVPREKTTNILFKGFSGGKCFFQSMATLRISRDLKTGGLEIQERCCIESISSNIGTHLITDNCVCCMSKLN